jgi:16S rRNA (guanine1516-N2)-methyltransferase
MIPTATAIAVWTASPDLESIVQELASRLQLTPMPGSQSLRDLSTSSFHFALAVIPSEISGYLLELHDLTQKNTKLFIDYSHGEIAYRAQHGGGRKQALGRAMGIKPGHMPNVIDATAGLGRDAFVLANLGCSVRMIERSPIMACLLEDALRRAEFDQHLNPWINQRLKLISGDARRQIPLLCGATATDVVYIDPMYPPRTKSALVKKEMRFIQALAGEDMDSSELLAISLRHATKRVVVKRPGSASPVAGPKPTHTIESKNTRYDVYVKH